MKLKILEKDLKKCIKKGILFLKMMKILKNEE